MKIKKHILTLVLCAVGLSGCVGTRYLKKDQKLLYSQRIKGNENISTSSLENFYSQEPNSRILFLPVSPYVWLYQLGKKHYHPEKLKEKKKSLTNKFDNRIAQQQAQGHQKKVKKLKQKKSKKINKVEKKLQEGNILMRWGEPLAIYDSAATSRTMQQMALYMHSKGYFSAKVDSSFFSLGKRVSITYKIDEGQPHYIDTVTYVTGDTAMLHLIKDHFMDTKIEQGAVYDQSMLVAERERLENLLRNNGYFGFSRQYIEFNVFNSPDTNRLDIETIINKPAEGGNHKVYKLDRVNFTTDANMNYGINKRTEENYKGITYYYFFNHYNKKILSQRVFLRPGEKYSRQKTLDTQRQLANLDIFKFVNINYDTTGNAFIANIFTSPLPKYQASHEVGLSVNISQGVPGPYYNLSLKNRNPFGSLEIMELNLRAGIEGVAVSGVDNSSYKNQELGTNLSFTFPHFLLPLGTKLKTSFGVLNPKTTLSAGYTYTNRPQYTRSNFNGNLTYSWQRGNDLYYNYTVADVNRINTSRLSNDFDSLLRTFDTGAQLIRAFEPSFVSSSNITVNKNFNNYGGYQQSRSAFIRGYLENGGAFLAFNKIRQSLDTSKLQYYQFVKAAIDLRQYLPLKGKGAFAMRLHLGFAKPYGPLSKNVLPYEKYFFAGGSNSIRAWTPRRLGPGSYDHGLAESEDHTPSYQYEQPGEILLESSMEVRRHLVGFLDGAFFVDAGNVWTLQKQEGRPGSQFQWADFYKEIAVGTGLGLRMDFSFVILRFDFAFKVFDPIQPLGSRFVLNKANLNLKDPQGYGPVINLGIGYPF